MIDPKLFSSLVPSSILNEAGSVFYSGMGAFKQPSDIYILGLNPGGSPSDNQDESIGTDLKSWSSLPEFWSAYADACWEGFPAGQYSMQPRVVHLFEQLGQDLRMTPASNVVFVRTRNETDLAARKSELLDLCWPVHEALIQRLSVRTILCFGATAGRWVRQMLSADMEVGSFKEDNYRGWTSVAHTSPADICVVTLTHPSRADWRNPSADPTPLVRKVVNRV